MTRFEEFKNMDIEAFVKWIDKHGQHDDSPWNKWFEESYCQRCESVMAFVPYLNGEHECTWCEVNGKCRYFQELDGILSCKDVVKMWLEGEIK